MTSPGAIRASLPEQGRVLTFKRTVVVDPWADLNLHLAATAARSGFWAARLLALAATVALLSLCALVGLRFRSAAL